MRQPDDPSSKESRVLGDDGKRDSIQLSTKNASLWRILNSRSMMFGILFGVTGFLGIPFLWLSPVFSVLEKLIWSVVVTVYTCILIWITVMICMWSYHRTFG